jgi:hypothetical protein
VLTKGLVNNGADRRIAYSLAWLKDRQYATANAWLPHLQELCGETGSDGIPPICLRGETGGTVSSSIIVVRRSVTESSYWHAQGPPDLTPYEDHSQLLSRLS